MLLTVASLKIMCVRLLYHNTICWVESVKSAWAFLLSNQAQWKTKNIRYKVFFSWRPLWKDGRGRHNKRSIGTTHTPSSLWSCYLVIISLNLAEGVLNTEEDKPTSEIYNRPSHYLKKIIRASRIGKTAGKQLRLTTTQAVFYLEDKGWPKCKSNRFSQGEAVHLTVLQSSPCLSSS